jgi:hypothetical protein
MSKLNKGDVITSVVVGSTLLSSMLGSFIILWFIVALALGPARRIRVVAGVLVLAMFIASIFIAGKLTKRFYFYFMKRTEQKLSQETYRNFWPLTFFSPVGIVLADLISKDNLPLDFAGWLLALAVIYLFARRLTLGKHKS